MTGSDYKLASRAVVVNCICVISLAISLTACGDQFKGATDAAAYDLLDPKSAQFRDLRYRDTYVCGQMNGKNRMGAYAGFSNFLAYENGDKWVAERFENGKDQSRFVEICEKRTDEELEATAATSGDEAESAKTQIEERKQNEMSLPERCIVPWESVSDAKRSVSFDFSSEQPREYEYYDDKIGSRMYGRFFFENATTISFTTTNGEQSLVCNAKSGTATIFLEDGSQIKMVPLGS